MGNGPWSRRESDLSLLHNTAEIPKANWEKKKVPLVIFSRGVESIRKPVHEFLQTYMGL